MQYMHQKMLPNILAAGLALGAITGCKEGKKVKIEISDVLHENATVITRIYTPSRHDTKLGFRAIKMGGKETGSIGIDYGGDIGVGIGSGVQISSSTVPERYGAVFKCQHGTFTSQGSDKRHKDLYEKLQDGQEVDVTYKEIYRETYDDIDGDGKKDLVERVLTGFDFLDANPKK